MSRKLTGIRPWKGKRQAYVQVSGRTYYKSFPLTKPIAEIRAWREQKKKDDKKAAAAVPAEDSFAADIATYLTRVKAMPTYTQRAAHLALWSDALGGDRSRQSITSAEIDAVMQAWLTTPTNQPDPTLTKEERRRRGRPSGPGGLAPATVKKRRTALLELFITLDGKKAENPVRGSKCPREPKPEARGLDYPTLARVLTLMPDLRSSKPGAIPRHNLAKLRATVMAYTGFPPGVLAAIQMGDLDLARGCVRVQRRLKGKGTEARTIILQAPAIVAFRALIAARALGVRFAVGPVNVAFKRACKRAGVRGVHLYDIRHSFGAELYRQTNELPTVGRAMLHAPGSVVTHRYTLSAHQEVDAAAAAKMSAALEAQLSAPVQESGRNVSQKPDRSSKSRVRRHLSKAS